MRSSFLLLEPQCQSRRPSCFFLARGRALKPTFLPPGIVGRGPGRAHRPCHLDSRRTPDRSSRHSRSGQDSPTIVLDAGGGNDGLTWAGIKPKLARLTQVCSSDRAGIGWSDPGPYPRNATAITMPPISAPWISDPSSRRICRTRIGWANLTSYSERLARGNALAR